MKNAKLALLLLSVVFVGAGSTLAGDGAYVQQTTTIHVRQHRGPFAFLGRVCESVLHAPQILAEGIEGERALVNRRGFLAPREVPVEDCILSPADGVFTVK